MPDVSAAVRSLPYPVLEDGSLSYPAGDYAVEATAGDDGASVMLQHRVTGAPFLDTLLRTGRARYGCLVSVPLTGYRRLDLSEQSDQHIQWDHDVLGEPPLIRALIVTVASVAQTLGPDDGVAEGWQGRPLRIPQGARLALTGYMQAIESLHYLLELRRDDTLPAGACIVAPCTENGFYFRLAAADDLYRFLQHPRGHDRHRRSVLTHAVSRCFEILVEQYGPRRSGGADDQGSDGRADWRMHRNLRALAAGMQRRGLRLWDEDGFTPDEAATKMYPHQPPEEPTD